MLLSNAMMTRASNWCGTYCRSGYCASMNFVHENLTYSVIGAFYEVYNTLGFGFVESIYAAALERELRDRGHAVAREASVRVFYKEQELGTQRLDMIVDRVLVVEVKSTQHLSPVATRQLLNYLRATNLEVGLLLHFGRTASVFRLIATHSKGQIEPLLESLAAEQSSGSDGS
jgi:GxxExxY protein